MAKLDQLKTLSEETVREASEKQRLKTLEENKNGISETQSDEDV